MSIDVSLPASKLTREMFVTQMRIHNGRLAVVGPLWEFNPRYTWDMFLARYRRNPAEALINFASAPPTASRIKFYQDIELVRQKADPKRWGHPFKADRTFENWFRPRPAARYVLHFDLSEVKDPTALAMAHWDFKVERVFLDFTLEIIPDKANPIRLQVLEDLVYALQDRGFEIAQVSTDLWGSQQLRQNLEVKGIKAIQYSVDKTTEAHETLYSAIFSGLLDFYPYEPLFECLDNLYWFKGGKKLDHLPGKKKDMADAAAGAVTQALKLEGFTGVPEIETVDLQDRQLAKEDESDKELMAEFEPLPRERLSANDVQDDDLDVFIEGDDMDDLDTLDPDDDGIPY